MAIAFDEKKIDAIFTELDQCHLPGAAVGIAIGGKPVYRKGFGLASMELPLVLSPTIRMRIYSTTKHFTCLAYMLLCEEGKAGIDDPIGKFLPELHRVTRKVTMRQLMGHVSGIRDVCDIRYQFSGTDGLMPITELLCLYRDIDDVNFEPGTGWNYNNGGYQLLSVAIERITGQPLEDVMRTCIFEPVGMHDTLLRRLDSDFLPNSATMHMSTAAEGFDKSYLGGPTAGEGGIVSTVDDMLRWLAHMDAPRVGRESTWEIMKAPQVLANGVSTGYGLGLMIDQYCGIETVSHGGGGLGSNSQMIKVPAAGLDVAIMVNRHDVSGTQLADKILDACLPGTAPINDVVRRPFVTGTFRSPTSGRVIRLSSSSPPYVGDREAQQIASIDGADLPFEPKEDGTLRPAGIVHYMKLAVKLVGDPETPASIQFSDFGDLDELVAVRPAEKVEVGAIAGRYRSESTGTEASIAETEDGPRLNTLGRFGSAEFALNCLAAGIWQAKTRGPMTWGGVLSFERDGATFRFSSARTRALVFQRCA
jgi:CubicO group peptidase (beta-lactamase class C family)